MIDVEKMITKKYPKLKNSKVIKGAISKFADSVVHEAKINKFIQKNKHLGSFEFIDEVLQHLNFNFLVSDKDIQNIPSSGRVVIIANHPLGSLDALALIKLISNVRKDIKVVANDFLEVISPIKNLLININNFKSRQKKEAITKVYAALDAEEAVIIFPSGEVSRAGPTGIKDKIWHKGFLKFAKKGNAPILPVFIGGKNSKTFYSVSTLNKKLAALLLSHEMFKQKNKSIQMIVGELIPYENILPKGIQKERLVKLYKKHLYALKENQSYFITQKPIAHPEDRRDIKRELKSSQLLGQTKDGKKIYLYTSDDNNSIIINEIGRLRELSFRKVGEGINKKRDIDKYDRYYKHIILWDDEELEIVGAYRIAECAEIIQKLGINALYTTTLFNYNEAFMPYLDDAIELGRSFVQPKYWGSRALDYLWFGIGAYLKNNPHIRYMYGPVSLSESYSKIAKDMILYFYDVTFKDEKNLVNAKIPYNFKTDEILINNLKREFSAPEYKENFKTLKKALGSINTNIPTLYKQYADLCEEGGIKFCAYNIDHDFSNCIDSFIVVDITKIKDSQRKRYIN
ncbi:GNAT family N-acyltransferase [Sulfurimonas autotrophica]|uniref:Phospholipid/glycerol acyltransferase n=1 Tax=Sulfurimonas autotrophica (strain ATCC BAA-671 / DSM 16294 / JCM 11897 / OK10) TaxID=563040 RepID=E0UQP8_SULAO|nr:GNAT family N-acyltransferase [Sulfurimonas autotrophica]ADN09920.1 phospholipid/glycerol acyltransferase [Sulfurimonas autotrophica DSM 16294]